MVNSSKLINKLKKDIKNLENKKKKLDEKWLRLKNDSDKELFKVNNKYKNINNNSNTSEINEYNKLMNVVNKKRYKVNDFAIQKIRPISLKIIELETQLKKINI